MTDRTPPQSLDDEQAVLGSMMNDASTIDDVVAVLPDAEAFYLSTHRAIYGVLTAMHAEGVPIDLLLTSDRIRRDGVQGVETEYLVNTAQSYGDTANAAFYARVVRDCWQRRRMIGAALKLTNAAYDDVACDDPTSVCGECCRELEEIAAGGRSDEVVEAVATISDLTAAWLLPKRTTIGTGLHAYDDKTGGLERPSLTILAARPSTGKTSLALRMALAAASEGVPTFFVSIETTARKLAERMVAMLGGRSVRTIRGDTPDNQASTVAVVCQRVPRNMIFIADTLRGIHEIAAMSRAMVRRHKVGLIVVDHIQIMTARGRHENRNLEVASMSAALQALAKSTGACVLALSQLNRGVSETEPTLRSLRDSGAIEQDADVVIFLHRETVGAGNNAALDTVKLSVAKNRDGPLMEARYKFYAATMDFVPDVQGVSGHPEPGGSYGRDDEAFG